MKSVVDSIIIIIIIIIIIYSYYIAEQPLIIITPGHMVQPDPHNYLVHILNSSGSILAAGNPIGAPS